MYVCMYVRKYVCMYVRLHLKVQLLWMTINFVLLEHIIFDLMLNKLLDAFILFTFRILITYFTIVIVNIYDFSYN
jgi:hypothetical protein